ncbi:MAG: hypothetical protein Fur002_12540 [Anaerolineales bacterium]
MAIRNPLVDGVKALWNQIVHYRKFNRGAAWGALILLALGAFEIFNFSTTQFALHDVLGDLTYAGLRWSTVLAFAFCGIDFAGIARIFTPEQGSNEPAEVWYLFAAWILAAGFNATLTWWGVSVAIAQNPVTHSSAVMDYETYTKAVPVFVAIMVWLVRLLIIGTFSMAGDRLFTTADVRPAPSQYRPQYQSQPQPAQRAYNPPQQRPAYQTQAQRPVNQPLNEPVYTPALRPASQINRPANPANFRPAPKPAPTVNSQQTSFITPEPTYHPLPYGARAENSERHYDA